MAVPIGVALYARVSTRDKDQDVDLQLEPMRARRAHGIDRRAEAMRPRTRDAS
jgi:hypothetical protein